MATINFLLQGVKNPTNIYLRFRDGKDIDLKVKTNNLINPLDWSKAKQRPKSIKHIDYLKLKENLDTIEKNVLIKYNSIEANEKSSSKWLKDFINPPIKTYVLSKELLKYFDYYTSIKKNEVTNSTIKKYNVVKALLKRYEVENKTTLKIKEVNNEFKQDFINYCLDNLYADGTIQRSLKFIKTICLHAQSNNLEVSKQIQDFKYSATKGKIKPIYLTIEELETIDSFEYSESLENVKDWLLISCYTGQRISDFLRFDASMVSKRNGKPYIEFKQQKTNKNMAIALHSKVIEILQKRNGAFPKRISDQKYNLYIKEVCEIAGINEKVKGKILQEVQTGVFRKVEDYYPKFELITSHIGRRSLASNYYTKIPTSLLMSMTGHTTERQFLEYIGKSEIDSAMEVHNYF